MRPLLVIDAVGLAWRHVGERTPNLRALRERGAGAPMTSVLPAVTCSAQASMLTGLEPGAREGRPGHGVVGNGWFDREYHEVGFWKQSNALVSGEKLYETARHRDPAFTCAKLFWWWNMGARVDWSVTPRPHYPADGRKLLDVYGQPEDFRAQLVDELGPFPFFDFWGPRSGLASSRWIADATIATLRRHRPTLTLAYLPHLDYDHQRYGPDDERSLKALEELDVLVGDLVAAADEVGAATVVVSEYAIEPVSRPILPNRALREAGLLEVRQPPPSPAGGHVGERLDLFASRAFCVVDHQLAHVQVRSAEDLPRVRALLAELPGVATVLEGEAKAAAGLDHPRAGDLVLLSEPDAWFAYNFWLDDAAAPDFAPTVAIHDKPGYDPAELFVDPTIATPKLRVASRLLRKKLGLRYLMDVIPLDPSLVGGSHGLLPAAPERGPVFLSTEPFDDALVEMTSVKERLLGLMFD